MVHETITKTVNERYARAVVTGEEMCCPTGYNYDELRTFIPDAVLKVSYGCGTPAGLATVQPGETVLDIGSGGGIDCFEAARRVGPSGQVIGIDMTDEMLALARTHAPLVATNLGYPSSNIEFRKGQAEAMPVDDQTVDLIISNCVINLAPDKSQVFQEMYRVLRPGGRFTISDIVSDRPIPNYLLHNTEKWGDCLSGALQVGDYYNGLQEAGFLGLHQVTSIPWKVIDGIHFVSLTLTGYKLPHVTQTTTEQFATLVGPFRRAVDEWGRTYVRGIPEPIDAQTAQLLRTSLYDGLFFLSDTPITLTPSDPRWMATLPEEAPCVWKGHFALLSGPLTEVEDDDHHMFHRGIPLEICSKTQAVLESATYQRHFLIINRAGEVASSSPVSCDPSESCC